MNNKQQTKMRLNKKRRINEASIDMLSMALAPITDNPVKVANVIKKILRSGYAE